jgi:hypothetical protein
MYFGNRAVIILTVPGSGVKVLAVSKSISSSDKFLLEGDDDSAKLVYKNDPSQCLVRAKAYIGLVPCQSSEAQVLPAVPFTVAAFEETKVISPQAKEFARFRIKNENNCAVGFNGGSNNIYLPTALSCSQSIGEFQIFEDGSLKLNGKPVTFSRGSKSVKLSTSNTQFTTEDKFRIASGKFLVLQDSFQLCLNFDGTNLVKKVCSSTGNVPIEFTFLAKDLSKWFADLSTMPVQKEATSRTPSIRLQMTQILTDDLTAKKFLGCAYVNSMGFVEMVRVDQFGCPDSSPVFRQRKDGTIWYGDKPLGFKTHPEKSMNGMQFLAVLDDLNEAKLFDSVASRGLTKSPLRLLAGISGPTTDVIVQQESLITIADGRTFTANPSLILVGATIQQESFLPPTSLSPVIRFKLGDLAKSGCARSFSDGNNIFEISTIFNPISTQDQLDICLSSQSTFALMSDDSLTYNGKPVTFATSGGFGQANERNLAFSRSGFGTLDSFRTDISGNKMLRAAFLLNNLCFNLGFDGKFYQSNCGFASDSVNSFVPILLENGLASSRFTPFPLNILLLSYSGKTISNDNGPAGWARCAALHPSSEFVKFEEPALFYGCMNSLPMQITPEGVLLGAGRQLSFVADNSTDELRLAVNNSPISSTDRFGIKYGNLIYASDPSKCIAYQGNFIVLKDCPASYNPMGVLTAGVDPVVVSNLDSTLSGFQYPLFAPQMVSPRTGVVGAPIPFRIYDGFGCAYGKNLGTQFPIVFSAGDEQENCQSAKSLFYYFEGLVYYNNGYPLTIQASISGEISLAFSLTSSGGPNYNLVQENGLDYIVLPFGCFYRLPFGSIGIDTKRSECSAQTGTSNRLQIVIGEQFQVPNPVVPTSTPLPPFVTATLTQDPFTSTQLVTETVPGVDKTRTVVVYQTATLSLSTTVSEGFTKTVPTLVTVAISATVTVDTTVINKSTILKTETIYGTSTVTLNPATRTK